ncbi:MAG: hypothetical protein FK730_13585 [Asgard group archaeon]|nr:hypothetical protein [Asgard group archaeon]
MSDEIKTLKEKYETKLADTDALENYVDELVKLVYKFQNKNKIEPLLELIQIFEKLMKKNASNKSLQTHYGQTIVNSLPLFFVESTPIETIKIINNLRAFAYDTKSNLLIEFLAMTLTNAIYDFSLIQKIGSISEFGIELIDLSRKYPKLENIQNACAKGLMNATMFFLQNNDQQAASNYYEALIKIIENHPGKDMVDTMRLLQLKEYFK